MGLDMYLDRAIYIGAEYGDVTGTVDIRYVNNDEPIKIDFNKISYIYERVAYWRKANAIHGWIINNCAHGIDDCRRVDIDGSTLIELRELCQEILNMEPGEERDKKASELLPPTEGFFFGNNVIDDDYYYDLEITVDQLKDIDEEEDYCYQASW